ncbi:hypothetical protein XENTR_v10008255 [Xenopus tropicalis]|nr:hypothetical protein XENTR_v10008255 [Xenopus tropicalis]
MMFTHDGLPSLTGEEVLTILPNGFTDALKFDKKFIGFCWQCNNSILIFTD